MNLKRSEPLRLALCALAGNFAGAVAAIGVVFCFLVAWGEVARIGALPALRASMSFAITSGIVGAMYLLIVVPALIAVLRVTHRALFPLGAAFAVAPGAIFLSAGNYYFGSAGLAQGIVAGGVACWLLSFRASQTVHEPKA